MFDYNYVGQPSDYGGRFSFDANTWSIYRREGTRDQRVYSRAGWTLPYTANSGEIYTLNANVQGYLYNVSNIGPDIESNRPTEDGSSARLFPQMSMEWRYPFVRRGEDFRTVVEPIVSFIAAPNIGNQSRYPNEDSRSVDFDDTNLFRLNRFAGADRLEGGQRVVYGFNTNISRYTGGRASAFLGQSYRLRDESAFPTGSGLDEQRSNIVGRLSFSPHPWLYTAYRFQLDSDNFEARRSYADLVIGPPALNLTTSYIFIDQSSQTILTTDLEQLQNTLNLRLTDNWLLQGRSVRDLGEQPGQLLTGVTLFYEDECFLLGLDWTKRQVGNRDNPPDTAFIIRLIFRNLGEVKAKG
jgi:LPS-assembly protein